MGLKFARATSATWGLLVLLGTGRTLLTQENDKGAIIAIRVTDVSGAAVEGAEVLFVEQTRRAYEVKRTDKTGRALAELKPGKYEVKVTATRFKSVVIHYIEVAAAEHKQFEVSLEALPPVPDIVDPVEPLIEPAHIEPRDTEIRERFTSPYVDEPLTQLVERLPELKSLQPAADQQQLPMILQKIGERMDDFVRDVGNLIAHEQVTQEKLKANGDIEAKERFQDEYLILHHGNEWGSSAEYRMDDKGNQLGPVGLSRGYLVTSGHALSCIQFSTAAQSQSRSRFRYLGNAMLGSRETYVLAFAQRPDEVGFATVMKFGAKQVQIPTQGILWVDKGNFQILRIRSDLLAPNSDIQLEQRTTDVTLAEVRLQDVPNPLWLPSHADVYIEIDWHKFRNLHRYTHYRRYRVSVKIGAPH